MPGSGSYYDDVIRAHNEACTLASLAVAPAAAAAPAGAEHTAVPSLAAELPAMAAAAGPCCVSVLPRGQDAVYVDAWASVAAAAAGAADTGYIPQAAPAAVGAAWQQQQVAAAGLAEERWEVHDALPHYGPGYCAAGPGWQHAGDAAVPDGQYGPGAADVWQARAEGGGLPEPLTPARLQWHRQQLQQEQEWEQWGQPEVGWALQQYGTGLPERAVQQQVGEAWQQQDQQQAPGDLQAGAWQWPAPSMPADGSLAAAAGSYHQAAVATGSRLGPCSTQPTAVAHTALAVHIASSTAIDACSVYASASSDPNLQAAATPTLRQAGGSPSSSREAPAIPGTPTAATAPTGTDTTSSNGSDGNSPGAQQPLPRLMTLSRLESLVSESLAGSSEGGEGEAVEHFRTWVGQQNGAWLEGHCGKGGGGEGGRRQTCCSICLSEFAEGELIRWGWQDVGFACESGCDWCNRCRLLKCCCGWCVAGVGMLLAVFDSFRAQSL